MSKVKTKEQIPFAQVMAILPELTSADLALVLREVGYYLKKRSYEEAINMLKIAGDPEAKRISQGWECPK